MKRLLFSILLLVTGCAGTLKEDPSWPTPIDAEYPSAEVWACGRLQDMGQNVCSIERGQPYDKVKMAVAVYYKGTVKVSSTNCGLETELSYEKTGLFDIQIPGIAQKNCVVVVTVIPQLPDQKNSGIRVYGLRGYLAIRVLDKGNNWTGTTKKITGSFSSKEVFWIGRQKTDVDLVIDGCGLPTFKKKIPAPTEGIVEFNLNEVIPKDMPQQTCVLQGYFRSQVYKDSLFNIMVSNYDERFTPLPIPVVNIDKEKIEIVADSSVSIIAVNDEYKIANKAKFKFVGDRNVVRLLTVNGRTVTGIWERDKGWTWKN